MDNRFIILRYIVNMLNTQQTSKIGMLIDFVKQKYFENLFIDCLPILPILEQTA